MKKFFKEFKEFALKSNVISMATGVIIGVAFQGLITSLTDNILTPILGLFVRQNFDYLELHIFHTTIRYGSFISDLVNFLIMAMVVFLMVRTMNRILAIHKKKDADLPPAPEHHCPYCLTKIDEKATRCPACTSELLQ